MSWFPELCSGKGKPGSAAAVKRLATARRGKQRFPLLGNGPSFLRKAATRGYSTMAVHQLPKLATRVRFPLPAVLLMCAGCATGSSSYLTPAVAPSAPSLQPRGTVYRVQRGESLWRIARDFGVDVQTLASANQLSSPSQLKAGQQLLIPLPRAADDHFLWPARGSFAKVAIGSVSADLESYEPPMTFYSSSRAMKNAAKRVFHRTLLFRIRRNGTSRYC